jgi:hypothetical protein
MNYPNKKPNENLKFGKNSGKVFGQYSGNSSTILFSPASASFEKFKNEFDRGKKFNKIIKAMLK